MRRPAIITGAVIALSALLFGGAAHAVDVLTSGEDTFLVIDVDGDGPDEEQDCRFLVELSGSRYTATPVQSPVTLRASTGNLILDLAAEGQDSSSDWAKLNMSASGVQAAQGEPGHRWLVAVGPYDGDTATLEVFNASGMVFDSSTPPVMEEQLAGASIIIRWSNCRQATLTYDIPTLGLQGEIHIERSVDDNVAACEAGQNV